MSTIGFLHTSEVHIATFNQLLADCDERVAACSIVEPSLLEMASSSGITDELLKGVDQALKSLVIQGADEIVCTCSTLGAIVEGRVINGVKVHRIDRAAANELMQVDKVLVLAAIESAAEAADSLLEQSGCWAETSARWVVAIVPGAWESFESGRLDDYYRSIADFANRAGKEYDAIFLSQASMMNAKSLCTHGYVVTTPETGIQSLVSELL